MSRQTRRSLLATVGVGIASAGCLNAISPSGSTTGSPTPLPNNRVSLPDGPKSPPEHPTALSVDSVREFVLLYEYRFVYNSLWRSDETAVSISCQVDDARSVDVGYSVTVTCSGRAETEADGNTPIQDEWPRRTVTYLVDEDSVVRE